MNRRFFCEPIPVPGSAVALSAAESRHVQTVLRAREGDKITLLDGNGARAAARITAIGRKRDPVTCEILTHEIVPRPKPDVRLYVAPPRGKQFAQIIRRLTELGAARITPITTERSESKPTEAPETWSAAAIEACKQSGNPYLPSIDSPQLLKDLLTGDLEPGYVGCVPDGHAAAAEVVRAEAIGIWIGPEGGFTPEELEALLSKGLQPLQIGAYTLRVGTAAIAALSRVTR